MANEQNALARFPAPHVGLDANKGVALYVQLADLFRYNIVSGAWASGHRLDNFDILAERYQIARITVRQAVARLVQEGLLSSQRGRGTFVLDVSDRLGSPGQRVKASGMWPADDLKIQVLHKERVVELPREFRGDFEVFDSYIEIVKVHVVHDTPFAMVRVFVAEEVYRAFPRRSIEKSKILRLVFAHAGRSAEKMRQRMTVEPADAVLSRQLQYAVGSPLAKILRQVYGANRRLSYAGVSWYRGDSFEMDITLPRALVEDSSPGLIAPGLREG